jgi:hypothetical protein
VRAPDASRATGSGLATCALVLLLLGAGCQQTVTFLVDGGGGGSGGTPGNLCMAAQNTVEVRTQPEMPEVVLALDRSTSMNAAFGGTTEIAAAQDALAAVVAKYAARNVPLVSFDYVEFPSADFNCGQTNPGCCVSQVSVVDSRSFADPNGGMLHRCDTGGPGCPTSSERPIGAALLSTKSFFNQFGQGGPKRYVLLLTDGEPSPESDCPFFGTGGGGGSCTDEAAVIGQLGRNAETAVVAINYPNDQCLSMLGEPGQFGSNPPFPPFNSSPWYASVASPSDLSAMLDGVVGEMARENACHLDLIPMGSPPQNPSQVTLSVGTTTIPRGGPDGWQFNDTNTTITLSGMACMMFLAHPDSLSVVGCNDFHH